MVGTTLDGWDTMDGSKELREREKELDFVYALASLLSASSLDESRVATQAADRFRRALTRPELAQVRVCINGNTATSQVNPGVPCKDLPGNILRVSAGEADVCWLEAGYRDETGSFSERELDLAESTVRLLAISASRMVSDRHDAALKLDLERKNSALSELLSRIELEKKGIRDSIASRLKDCVLPLLAHIEKVGISAKWSADIRRELGKAVSGPAEDGLSLRNLLSARELEICALVSSGLSSKEIAGRLGLAVATVERHRHNARRKLGLPARQGSLGSIQFDSNL